MYEGGIQALELLKADKKAIKDRPPSLVLSSGAKLYPNTLEAYTR
ncbi:MAG: hypothetical protein WAM14_00980 [Candidatus Nitrosopolaris sp.]